MKVHTAPLQAGVDPYQAGSPKDSSPAIGNGLNRKLVARPTDRKEETEQNEQWGKGNAGGGETSPPLPGKKLAFARNHNRPPSTARVE